MFITQLKYFVAVSKALNFREAARRLGASQSSVSRQIVELEKRLGVELFTRSKRGAALTDEGKAYLPYAMDILGTVESSEYLMRHYKTVQEGRISLAALSTSGSALMKALDLFYARYPAVAVDVSLNNGSDQVVAMTESKYDFLFAHEGMLPSDDRLDYLVTHRDSMALVVPKGHKLTGRPLSFSELEDERFIVSIEPGTPLLFSQIQEIWRAHGFTPKAVSRFDKVESVMLAISAGLGVSIMPSALPKVFFSDSVDVIPIEDMDTWRTYVAAWPRQSSNPSAKLFLEVLRECFGGEPQQ